MLLERGARQLASMEGATPLIIALQYRHPAIALDLARASPTPSLDVTVPVDGSSALFVAAGYGYTEVDTCTPSAPPCSLCSLCSLCPLCSLLLTMTHCVLPAARLQPMQPGRPPHAPIIRW